jgi:uncharacterized OB-fold protein
MSETIPPKPLPVVDADTRPFWEGARARKLMVQRCGACRKYVFYPRALCPHCHSARLDWTEASGKGTIYSFTIARRPAGAAFQNDVPYVIALIDLEEGVRMMSNIITDDVDSVRIGQRVRVVFEDVGPEIALPKFQVVP